MSPGRVMCLSIFVLFTIFVQAQQSQDGRIRINGGSVTGRQSPSDQHSVVTVYSDLARGKNVYLSQFGYGVIGPQVQGQQKVATATPFTPTGNFNVVRIEVAILNSAGTNGVTLSLNADNNGQPGTAIRTWNFVNLPKFPGCCGLDVAKLKKTVRVNRGTQYWLVAKTSQTTEGTSDMWNMNSLSILGTVGQRIANYQWQIEENLLLPAFAVLGTPAK
jgi:hypothetical protein